MDTLVKIILVIEMFLFQNTMFIVFISILYMVVTVLWYSGKLGGKVLPRWSKDIRNYLIHLSIPMIMVGTTLGLPLFQNEFKFLFFVCPLLSTVLVILIFYSARFVTNLEKSSIDRMPQEKDKR